MSTHLLGSTVLMALIVVAVFAGIARVEKRQQAEPEGEGLPATRSEAAMGQAARTANSPARLGAAFVVLALVGGALSLAAVGGSGAEMLPGAFGLVVGLFGLLLTGFVFLGSYVVVRQHGLGHAHGVAAGLLCVGGVSILAVAANLVFGFA